MVWLGFFHAMLAPAALLISIQQEPATLFMLCSVLVTAGGARLLASQQVQGGHAVWAVQSTLCSLFVLAAPILGVSRPTTALGLALAIEATAVMNLARSDEAGARFWSGHALVLSLLAAAAFFIPALVPPWPMGLVIAAVMLSTGVCCTRVGMVAAEHETLDRRG